VPAEWRPTEPGTTAGPKPKGKAGLSLDGSEYSMTTVTTTPTKCPLCSAADYQSVCDDVRDYEYGAPGTYSWLRCKACGLIRLWPEPTPEVLNLAYPEWYHAYVPPNSGLTQRLIGYVSDRLAASITSGLSDGAAVLDVGCSTGTLLERLGKRKPLRLYGVEYRESAAEAARAKGITVWQGDFEAADIPPGSFDLVIMQHVLEHVFDPIATLRKVREVLKPGGRVLGELPNFDSWDAKLFGRYWGGGHAPRHLWFFTPVTMRKALANTGFSNVDVRGALHTGHWALSFQNFFRRNAATGLRGGRTWYYPPLLLATIPFNLLQMPLLKTGIMRFSAHAIS
jgi:SAM-dependent methyltransferase